MQLIYCSHSQIPSRTANSIQVMKMCEAFAANGHSVHLLARRGAYSQDFASFYGIRETRVVVDRKNVTWSIWGRLRYTVWCFHQIRKANRRTLVYGRSLYGLFPAMILRRRFIFEAHDVPASRMRAWGEARLLRSRWLQKGVVISQQLKNEYLKRFDFLESRDLLVAHDATDAPDALPVRPIPEWPGRVDAIQVAYIGHLYPGRGIDVLIDLARALPACDFHVIGGTDEDIARWQSHSDLRNLIWHGFVEPHAVDAYRAQCDILLLPYQKKVAVSGGRGDTSRWMSPLKLFESMASGKAIVCSRLPSLEEVLEHGRTAWLVPPDHFEGWKDAIEMLSEDASLRHTLGRNARSDAAAHYTWEIRARNVLEESRVECDLNAE